MRAGEVTAEKWKPLECPYCHVTFEKDWATAQFRPYPTFASLFRIRWAACSVCANPIITLEEEAGSADERGDWSAVRYIVRASHVLWPQTFRGLDPLTGVHDKQTFEGDVRAALDDARRAGDVVSLVYCDIDFFKGINDAHGHPVGDEVLRAYGGLLDARVKGKGTVYRIGGEEFAILMPRFEREVAGAQAESLRKQVEAARLANDARGQPLRVTSSFGVAAFPEDAPGADDLLRAADAALYLAKQSGRNRVAHAAEVRARP
jgi:diguanylate cyclase (GGDEF)-like protein